MTLLFIVFYLSRFSNSRDTFVSADPQRKSGILPFFVTLRHIMERFGWISFTMSDDEQDVIEQPRQVAEVSSRGIQIIIKCQSFSTCFITES